VIRKVKAGTPTVKSRLPKIRRENMTKEEKDDAHFDKYPLIASLAVLVALAEEKRIMANDTESDIVAAQTTALVANHLLTIARLFRKAGDHVSAELMVREAAAIPKLPRTAALRERILALLFDVRSSMSPLQKTGQALLDDETDVPDTNTAKVLTIREKSDWERARENENEATTHPCDAWQPAECMCKGACSCHFVQANQSREKSDHEKHNHHT
jgi:hypothetical protein